MEFNYSIRMYECHPDYVIQGSITPFDQYKTSGSYENVCKGVSMDTLCADITCVIVDNKTGRRNYYYDGSSYYQTI